MAHKISRSKRKELGINLKPREGLWISYRLRVAGIEQQEVARVAGVSEALVSRALKGTRNSPRVQSAVAQLLGAASWEALIAQARRAA